MDEPMDIDGNRPSSSASTSGPKNEDDSNEKRIRRSTREIKRPKFDDEIVESIPDIKKRLSAERMLHSPPISSSESTPQNVFPPAEKEQPEKKEEKEPVKEKEKEKEKEKDKDKDKDKDKEKDKEKDKPEATASSKAGLRKRISKADKLEEANQKAAEEAVALERRKREARIASKDLKSKELVAANEHVDSTITQTLKKWTAADDVMLLTAGTHVCDLAVVYAGIRFSKPYSLSEIEERWFELMYDKNLSILANKRFADMKPEEILRIQGKTIFSVAEEDLLAGMSVGRTTTPSLEEFERLRVEKREIFHPARTAQILCDYYQQLKMYAMLETRERDREKTMGLDRLENTFSLATDEPVDEILSRVTAQVINAEATVRNWTKVTALPVTGIVRPDRFESGVFARLHGRVTRYNIKSEKVVIGRSTADSSADVNLALEGPALKISRKQAIMERRANDGWWLQCVGQRPMLVDSRALMPGESTKLYDGAYIEIAFLRLRFCCAPMSGGQSQPASASSSMSTPHTAAMPLGGTGMSGSGSGGASGR